MPVAKIRVLISPGPLASSVLFSALHGLRVRAERSPSRELEPLTATRSPAAP